MWTALDTQRNIVSLVLIPIDQYLAFGISGSNTRTDMIGADVIVVWVSNGQPNAVDYLLTARQQVSIRWNYSFKTMYYIASSKFL